MTIQEEEWRAKAWPHVLKRLREACPLFEEAYKRRPRGGPCSSAASRTATCGLGALELSLELDFGADNWLL